VHVFHAIPYIGLFMGGPYTIPVASMGHHCKNGELSSNSVTISITRFTGPHKSSMRQYTTQNLFIQTQPTRALIDAGRGYHLRSCKFQISPLSSFPSSKAVFSDGGGAAAVVSASGRFLWHKGRRGCGDGRSIERK
jgi:hypothetical protein